MSFAAVTVLYRWMRGARLGLGDEAAIASGAWLAWQALPSAGAPAAVIGLMLAPARGWPGYLSATDVSRSPALAAATWIVWLFGRWPS